MAEAPGEYKIEKELCSAKTIYRSELFLFRGYLKIRKPWIDREANTLASSPRHVLDTACAGVFVLHRVQCMYYSPVYEIVEDAEYEEREDGRREQRMEEEAVSVPPNVVGIQPQLRHVVMRRVVDEAHLSIMQ